MAPVAVAGPGVEERATDVETMPIMTLMKGETRYIAEGVISEYDSMAVLTG